MPWIETCIAVCMIIAFLSLVCSAIQELLAKVFGTRGKFLLQGLASLLKSPGGTSKLYEDVLDNPLLRSLARNGDIRNNPPSAMPGGVFADALLNEALKGAQAATMTLSAVRQQLATLDADDPAHGILEEILDATERASGNWLAFRNGIVAHYDQVMERVGGWYKRRVAMSLAVIALGVAVTSNADLFHITRTVWSNAALRDPLNAAAASLLQGDGKMQGVPDLAQVEQRLARVPMPLGWRRDTMPGNRIEWASKVVGIIVAAAAMSLGAPFWFDVLRMLLSLKGRQGGRGPTPEEDRQP